MTLRYFTWKDVTEKDFARPDFQVWFREIVKDTANKNREISAEAARQYAVMLAAARQLYDEDSNEVRYLNKAGIPDPVNNASKEKKVWAKWEAWKKAQADAIRRAEAAEQRRIRLEEKRRQLAEEEAQRQIEEAARLEQQRADHRDYLRRRAEATAELERRGLVAGVDFDPDQAITALKRRQSEWTERDLELERQYRDYDA